MFKQLSIAMIFVAGIMISAEYTKNHKNEYKFTKGLINVFEYMSGEIMFQHNFLGETLKNGASFGGSAKEYIEEIADKIINKSSAKDAFLSVEVKGNERVYEILSEYFSQAGMFDVKTEKEKLDNAVLKLKTAERNQEEYIKNTVNQNRKIIIAFAVFVCIFMM